MSILNLGKGLTYSNAVNASFPSYPIDVLTSASGAWADDASTLPVSRARAHQVESTFGVGYTAWNGSSGNARTITVDLGSAMAPDRLIMKGYYGSDSIFRPLSSVVEWSDDNSAWTTVQSLTGLTAGGAPGARQWWIGVDTSGAGSHQYWRATLTLGGSFLFLSNFELHDGLLNIAEGRPYTVSPAANANFPDNFTLTCIYPGDSDFSTTAGKLTNGEHGFPGTFGTGVGWQLATTAVGTVRVDLGSAQAGDHVAVFGIAGNGADMRTPGTLALEWSDDDSAWSSVHSQSGLTVAQNNKGRWIYRVDISGESAHRYWRVQATNGDANTRFITLTQFEFWQAQGGEPINVDVGTAIEVELANPITPLISREVAVGTATEVELANQITASIARLVDVGTATERELANPITPVIGRMVPIGTATEVELGNPITPLIDRLVDIGTAVERELANPFVALKPIFVDVGTAIERELARAIAPREGEPFIPVVTCSTLAIGVECEITSVGVACAVLSIDVECETVDAYGQTH